MITMVEERKKTMRHFYRTCVINEMLMKTDENKTLFSFLSNQSQKGITVPASPLIKQHMRNTLRALVLHWNP